MKTLFSTVLIGALALGVLLVFSPGRADAWDRGPVVGFSLVVPPFGVSIGAPAPYYYAAPVYVEPPYPVYRRAYYSPYYGYGPYFRYRHRDHRGWRGDWGHRGWRGDWGHRGYGRRHGHWRR
ncbi:MAG: hypothetical protein P8013_11735 [Candidatus Sulfobium sp.]